MAEDTLVDFAVVAFREDGHWQVGPIPRRCAEELPSLLHSVRQQPTKGPILTLCSYGDDSFLVSRPDGDDVRLMSSDATAAAEWPVARNALELVGEPVPDQDDDQVSPAGDLDIFADFGLGRWSSSRSAPALSLFPARC